MNAAFVRRDPLSDRFLADWPLRHFAQARAEHAALIVGERSISYAELDRLVDGSACVLKEAGVSRGDRVLVAVDNGLAAVLGFYGALRADSIPILVGAPKRPRRVARVADLAEPKVVITDGPIEGVSAPCLAPASLEKASPVAPARRSIDLDLATICFTSGSLGEPKGVMLTHANLRNSMAAIGAYLEQGPDDVVLCTLPLSHTYGLFQLLVTHAYGGTLVLEEGFGMAFPLVKRLAALKVTGFAGVPTIFASILALRQLAEVDLSSLRYLTNAAYALPAAHLQRLHELLPKARFFAMYGQTECTRVCYLPPELAATRSESVGLSMPNQEAWLEREDGQVAEVGEVGVLVVRGSNVMRGYYKNPEATARALRPGRYPGEVVLYTSDLFRVDEGGLLTFVARQDDVIKTRGEKVAPLEVEQAICRLAEVKECAVVGVADPIHGVAVKAVVVLHEGKTLGENDIKRQVLTLIDDIAVPRVVVFARELPKSASGKVLKGELV